MTRKELWHVKIGTRVQKTSWNGEIQKGTVIHRQLDVETYGFMIAKEKKTGKIVEKDFLTGHKYLTIKIRFDNGDIRYIDTNAEKYRLDSYTFCAE